MNTKEPQLDDDVKFQLLQLQEKGIDINELIREMLEKREEGIAIAKDESSREAKPTSSRYIPVQVKRILHEEYGSKCSIPGCRRPSAQLHHTQRFALAGVHNPRYMAPMCEEHHKIAQSIDVKVQSARVCALNSGVAVRQVAVHGALGKGGLRQVVLSSA